MPNTQKSSTTLRGLVVRTQSGFFTVQTDMGIFECRLRGKLKRGEYLGDLAAIGDWVQVRPLDGQRGVIEAIEPRQRVIARMAPTPRGEYQQIIVANPDQAVFVFACEEPKPRFRMLDRFLVIAEKENIAALIVANKVDLVGLEQAQDLFGHYTPIGYPVIYTSARTGYGLEDLRQCLKGKLSVFAGPSGAGKTSLLNAIQPGLGLEVRQVSRATGKGTHTTVTSQMFPLQEGGYVADTPGLKSLALWDITPDELDGYFPEIGPLVAECQFSDCTHSHEPNCAVLKAVAEGRVHPARYESYLRLRLGEE